MRLSNRLKLRGSLIYLGFICAMLCMFVGLSIAKICTVSVDNARIVYGKYSSDAANAERLAIILNFVLIACGILLLIYSLLWLLSFRRNPGKKALIISGFVFAFVISTMYAFGCIYFKRERVKIIPQNKLTFDLVEIYGDDVEFTDEFENDIYEYYVTFANAYNNVMINGDYKTFFNSFNTKKIKQLDNIFNDFVLMQKTPSVDCAYADKVIKKGTEYNSKQIPAHSMAKGTLPLLHLTYKDSDGWNSEEDIQVIIDAWILGVNTMFDIFYGKELIAEDKIDYSIHMTKFKKSHMDVESLELNKEGEGKIKFTYYGHAYTCDIKDRMCRFVYSGEVALIHFTKSGFTFNGPTVPRNSLY